VIALIVCVGLGRHYTLTYQETDFVMEDNNDGKDFGNSLILLHAGSSW
jgi:hypothetical protein